MSAGDLAGVVAALAFAVLVGLVAMPLVKITRTLEEARRAIERLGAQPRPLRVTPTPPEDLPEDLPEDIPEDIPTHVRSVPDAVPTSASVLADVLAGPAVKVSAFSYGLRRAVQRRRAASPARARRETLARVRERRARRERERGAA